LQDWLHKNSRLRADFFYWPHSWMGLENDLPPGEALVVCFRLFIEHPAASSFSPKTIRRHEKSSAS
jgi:hypothetical protein